MQAKNTLLPETLTLNCRGRLLELQQVRIMGILNLTPDSFYASSRIGLVSEGLHRAERMLHEGADILDLGAQSSRPGSELLDASEELKRLLPLLEAILKEFPEAIVSIDTFYSKVAEVASQSGASLINDISSGEMDPEMLPTVGRLKLPYIAMHMQGTPRTMQQQPAYSDVVQEVLDYFIGKLEQCRAHGIVDVILDPGFGFGKTLEHNYRLLARLEAFHMLGRPLLAGLSRKSMIYQLLHTSPEQALNGTSALHMAALLKGVQLLRVHDVAAAREVVQLAEFYRQQI